jgi:hypothetical protein
MAWLHFLGWAPVGEIVKRQRLATITLRTGQSIGMTVVAKIRGIEDDHTIKNRHDSLFTMLHVRIPQFKVTLIVFFSIAIQVQQKVDTSIQLQPLVPVEIDVNVEMTTWHNLVQAATVQMRIRDNAFDAREGFEKINKSRGVQLGDKLPRYVAHRNITFARQFFLMSALKTNPVSIFRAWKPRKNILQEGFRKKIVQHNMGKGSVPR